MPFLFGSFSFSTLVSADTRVPQQVLSRMVSRRVVLFSSNMMISRWMGVGRFLDKSAFPRKLQQPGQLISVKVMWPEASQSVKVVKIRTHIIVILEKGLHT